MSLATTATRVWLTRSLRPFLFQSEYDPALDYAGCENLGLYVHIPFCRSLCDFCPYCKVKYDPALCSRYIDALLQEIRQVGRRCPGRKRVTSLYFGGGSPALAADRIGEIIAALEEHFEITEGVGMELHPSDLTEKTLRTLKAAGVTKISIGVQSFGQKFASLLGRRPPDPKAMARVLQKVPFETVSMDLIFALPGQTFPDIRRDIDTAFACGANHVAIYPFIHFTFTGSRVQPMPKGQKRFLLDAVTRYCQSRGYLRDSIWTFGKPGARYSSMTRDNFLGFGCSATTLLMDQFKINTFSVEQYCRRVGSGHLPTALTLRFTRRQRMVYYLFWTAYSTRVDPAGFERFFGVPLERMYGDALGLARALGFAEKKDGIYQMTGKGAFYYHYYENFYTLAYIDKMWGILRKEAFPREIRL